MGWGNSPRGELHNSSLEGGTDRRGDQPVCGLLPRPDKQAKSAGSGTPAGARYEGRVDTILMRIAEILLAFPGLWLLIGLASALGPGFVLLLIAFPSPVGRRRRASCGASCYRSSVRST